jgi:hypothetical protein
MKRKWQVGDVEDRTLDESVESSLGRIEKTFQNPKNWDAVMIKRQAAVERQLALEFDSTRECKGFGFMMNGIWPALLLENLLKWGGFRNGPKISFNCFYGPKVQSKSTALLAFKKKKLCFKNSSCFGCETLKDLAWNAIKDYFIIIKVGVIYNIIPNHKVHKIGSMVGDYGPSFIILKQLLTS